MICMDINYEEGHESNISPPLKFMAPEYVTKLLQLLKPNGLLTFNIICYDKPTLQKAVDLLKTSAAESVQMFFIHCESEMNYELFFVKGEASFEKRAENFSAFIKERGINKGVWLNEMEMAEMIPKIKPIEMLTGDEIKA